MATEVPTYQAIELLESKKREWEQVVDMSANLEDRERARSKVREIERTMIALAESDIVSVRL